MKALIVREFTDFDKAEVGDLPDPVPGPGEVVVDIHASETNFPDILYIEGKYQKKPPFPFSPGLAGAGVVSAVGEGVDAALKGRRVLALPVYGSHAEKLSTAAEWCFPIPNDMPFDTAASFGLVYQTGWFALMARGRMQAGETVLVLGASGGIGMAAVQLAKALGAGCVIAASRMGDAARAIGADVVIDSTLDRDTFRDAVKGATQGQGADVVIDPVGGELAGAALRAMAWQGRFVVVGFASGEIPSFAGNYLLVKNIEVSGIQWTDYRARQIDRVRAAQAQMFDLWQQGKLVPRITAKHPLRDYTKALAALKGGTASGKIILTMGDPE